MFIGLPLPIFFGKKGDMLFGGLCSYTEEYGKSRLSDHNKM